MIADVEHLDQVLRTRKAPTQRGVIRSLLRGRHAAFEIAGDVGVTVNAVNIALCKLKVHGVVEAPIRGRFYVREELIALILLDRVEGLERRLIRKGVTLDWSPQPNRGKRVSPPEASGPKPASAATEAG